eukprot:262922-Pyramimonas_sp.AAC.2
MDCLLGLNPKNRHHSRVPSRPFACTQIVKMVQEHPDHRILIAVDKFGKEELLAEVARAVGSPVYVSIERLVTIRLLGLPESAFAMDKAARIRAVPRYLLLPKYLDGQLQSCPKLLAIMPTGWSTAKENENGPALVPT